MQRSDSLQVRLATRLQREPEGRALTFVNAKGEVLWRSYREVYEDAVRFGSVFSERGLGCRDVCVLVLPPDELCATALLGCLVIGARPLLVAPPVIRGLHSNLNEVVSYVAKQTSARMLVMDKHHEPSGRDLKKSNPKTGPRVLFGSELRENRDSGPAPLAYPAATDIAALQLTSGTTGFPRICVWQQKRVLAALDGMETAMNLGSGDVCVNWTPLYHDMGLVNNFLLCLVKGIPLAIIETFDFLKKPSLWLRTLFNVGATQTWSPNFGFAFTAERVTDREINGIRLDHVRAFWNAAEKIHLETMRSFHRKFEPFGVKWAALKTNFGCAENVGGATFSSPNGELVTEHVDSRLLHERQIARPVADSREEGDTTSIVGVGRPYPGMSITIFSPGGRPLPDGHIGQIALQTPSRMSAYLGNARETRRALKGGFLRTGDLGYLRGNELFWVGRVRERINLHGKKFDPSDFEKVLLQIPDLRAGCFAAFGIDDDRSGTERLIILSEVRDATTLSHAEIMQNIREQMATQLAVTVDEVHLLERGTMTKTTSGKRRHRFYKQVYLDGGLRPLASLRKT